MQKELSRAAASIGDAMRYAKRLRHPHVVEHHGMTRSNLGDDRFFALNGERHHWLKANCIGGFDFDQLPDGQGQQYLFGTLSDAVHFKLRFPTRVVSTPLEP
jgi:hypothetical protein